MPLILHLSSCCDICTEGYDFNDLSKSPHAIECGHIFCGTCIRDFIPKVCPFCRKPFAEGHKLHVDAVESTEAVSSAPDIQPGELLEHIILLSSQVSTEEDALGIITEVISWMSEIHSDPNCRSLYELLHLALDVFCQHQDYLCVEDALATSSAVANSLLASSPLAR